MNKKLYTFSFNLYDGNSVQILCMREWESESTCEFVWKRWRMKLKFKSHRFYFPILTCIALTETYRVYDQPIHSMLYDVIYIYIVYVYHHVVLVFVWGLPSFINNIPTATTTTTVTFLNMEISIKHFKMPQIHNTNSSIFG